MRLLSRVGYWKHGFVLCLLSVGLWAQDSTAHLLEFADRIMSEVSTLRGLEVKHPVAKGVTNRKEIAAVLRTKIDESGNLEKLQLEGEVLARLGLIPSDYDFVENALDLLNEQLAGYYDPKLGKLFIADWMPMEQQRMTLAHELVHALQDQHFGLASILDEEGENDDRALARRAIVEGEAVAVMLDHMLRPMKRTFLNLPNLVEVYERMSVENLETHKQLVAAPEFLRESLTFPYSYGARFMQVYRKWHPWKDLEKVYADLPRSTEQILHPHKYTGQRDNPEVVKPGLPPAPIPGEWESAYRNVLGEFTTFLWLKQHLSEPTARLASRGWDGDSFHYFKSDDGRGAYYLQTVWDSEQDAAQFYDAYREMTESASGLELIGDEEDQLEWVSAKLLVRLERDRTRVNAYHADLAP